MINQVIYVIGRREYKLINLYPGRREANPHGDLFPHEDVRVVCLGEASLQLVELCWSEPGAVPLLLARLGGVLVVRRLEG